VKNEPILHKPGENGPSGQNTKCIYAAEKQLTFSYSMS